MKSTRITAVLWCVMVLFFYITEDSLFAGLTLFTTAGVLALSGILTAAGGRKCSLTVLAPENIGKDEDLFVDIKLDNRSLLPVCRYSVLLRCANILTGEEIEVPAVLSAGARKTAKVRMRLEEEFCGYVTYGTKEARVSDPLHLFTARRKAAAQACTYIMPEIRELALDPEELNAYDMESYIYSAAQKGNDPSETFGIREYVQGDSPKTIHWKLTGKMGDVVVRELGLPVENSIMILMDKRLVKGETLAPKLRHRATELFLSLSNTLLGKEMSHSVGWQSYKTGQFIIRRVTCREELWAVCGLLLESPYMEDIASTAVRYLETEGDRRYANYLYVTAGRDPDEVRLEGYGAVTVYRAENYK